MGVRDWLPQSLWFEEPFLYNRKPDRPGMPTPRCANFEKDYLKCAEPIGRRRAEKECALQFEDMLECANGAKVRERRRTVLKERAKLIKEGKYTIPDSPKTVLV